MSGGSKEHDDDRTLFTPPHRGKTVLPNTPFFTQVLRNAHRNRLAIRDDNAGLEKSYAQLLIDALNLRVKISDALPEEVVTRLKNEEEVFIGILAPGGYEYAVAMFAVLALGAAIVPMSKIFAIKSKTSTD